MRANIIPTTTVIISTWPLPPLFLGGPQLPRVKSSQWFHSSTTSGLTSNFTKEYGSLTAVHDIGSMEKFFFNLKKIHFCNMNSFFNGVGLYLLCFSVISSCTFYEGQAVKSGSESAS